MSGDWDPPPPLQPEDASNDEMMTKMYAEPTNGERQLNIIFTSAIILSLKRSTAPLCQLSLLVVGEEVMLMLHRKASGMNAGRFVVILSV